MIGVQTLLSSVIMGHSIEDEYSSNIVQIIDYSVRTEFQPNRMHVACEIIVKCAYVSVVGLCRLTF